VPETWGEWGTNVGNYYADRYHSPDDVPGLRHYGTETDSDGTVSNNDRTVTDNGGTVTNNDGTQSETWDEWGHNVGEYYSNLYGSPDDVPGLRHYKREPAPEPETWAEWGKHVGLVLHLR
jgi:hypothetical protein